MTVSVSERLLTKRTSAYPASRSEGITDVWFTIHGANLNLGADGQVEMVIDAQTILAVYRLMCAEQHGMEDPPVIVVDT